MSKIGVQIVSSASDVGRWYHNYLFYQIHLKKNSQYSLSMRHLVCLPTIDTWRNQREMIDMRSHTISFFIFFFFVLNSLISTGSFFCNSFLVHRRISFNVFPSRNDWERNKIMNRSKRKMKRWKKCSITWTNNSLAVYRNISHARASNSEHAHQQVLSKNTL